jgi:hypothetical protein
MAQGEEAVKGPLTDEERKFLTKELKLNKDLRAKDVMKHFPKRSGQSVGRFIGQMKKERTEKNVLRQKKGSFLFYYSFV